MIHLYRTGRGVLAARDGVLHDLGQLSWDDLLREEDLPAWVAARCRHPVEGRAEDRDDLLAPLGSQEVWASGVTYVRSREARVEESQAAGGGDIYTRVYEAARPEIFFKATPHRVVGHRQPIRLRPDATWIVPEPELALVLDPRGRIAGFTIGNDVSARDLEGENPLYLPQAKIWDGSCALGPGMLLAGGESLPPDTRLALDVRRDGTTVAAGETSLARMRRPLPELASYLMRTGTFPAGAILLTGTGIVPDAAFRLRTGDVVRITIEPIGSLVNTVA